MKEILKLSKELNIYDDIPELLSVSLGAAETTLIDLTSAYAPFVNGGKKIKAKLIVEGANGPTSHEADPILEKKGVVAVPDILANAGGVIVSYFEWVQNRLGFKWTKNRVYRRSDSIIKQAFNNVFAISKKYNISLRTAAYIAAIDKVSRTYKYRDGSFTFQKNGEDS